jgi:MFS family permease
MSSSYFVEPTSSGLEHDARLAHADEKPVSPAEIALGVVIGRTSEFFDFFVYGIASVLVFPAVCFPTYDALTGTLFSFAIFSLAFIARPIGSSIFMQVDRRYGRGTKLTIALFLLGGSTAAIAFLPSYSQVGYWSAGLLAICRIGQGLALGGAWDGLASLLALNAPQEKRGWYAMLPQLGAPLGLLLASALFAFFLATLQTNDFLIWAWRYPFFVAFAVNVVALFARLRLVVTREFTAMLDRRELEPVSTRELIRAEGDHIVTGAFAPLASFALFHLITIFPLSWIVLFKHRSVVDFLGLEMVSAVVGVFTMLISGFVADQFGRRKVLATGAILIAVFSFFAPFTLGAGEFGEMVFMLIGFALLGFSFAQASGAVASSFPLRYRYSGSAFTSDMAWLVGAAFAPLVALFLSARFGLFATGGYLLSGAVCTLLALRINKRLDLRDE